MKLHIRILFICFAAFMSACSTKIHLEKVSGPFPGIADMIATGGMSRLLIIHGMGNHKIGYSSELRLGISNALALDTVEYRGLKTILIPNNELSHAFLKVWDYKNVQYGKKLRVYELTWSPVTSPIKEIAFSEDQDLNVHRENVNAALKNFANEYLSDPILYLGKYGINIRYVVEQALCTIMKDNGNTTELEGKSACDLNKSAGAVNRDSGSIAIVSHSLGSKIVYDALYSLNEKAILQEKTEKNKTAKTLINEFVGRIRSVYMMANQITFLGLASIDNSDSVASKTYDSFSKVMNILSGKKSLRKEPIDIIAFTDPNDMLSYPLPEGYCNKFDPNTKARCTNVFINNNDSSLFGQLSNPVTAHTGYDSNDTVIKLIACGSKRSLISYCPNL